jgi:hypothetical protein
MKTYAKLALAALLTTAIAIPAYAQGTGGGTGSSTAGSSGTGTNSSGTSGSRANSPSPSAARGGADTSATSRVGADAGAGNMSGSVGANTSGAIGSTGTGTTSSGNTGTSASSSNFTRSDTDHSGGLSLNEYKSYNGTVGANARIQDDFRALDSDGNNFLSETELNARTSSSVR